MPQDYTIRPIEPMEQSLAESLWEKLFAPADDHFYRYFQKDPWYKPGDTMGAFVGSRLVSSAHICRRPVEIDEERIWMAGLACVGTLSEHQKKGPSRELLLRLTNQLETERLGFGLALGGDSRELKSCGWVPFITPEVTLRIKEAPEHPKLVDDFPISALSLIKLHHQSYHYPLFFRRPEKYFNNWCEWYWSKEVWNAVILNIVDGGYAVITVPCGDEAPVWLVELRAVGRLAEDYLLKGVVSWAVRRGKSIVRMDFIPPKTGLDLLRKLGDVRVNKIHRGMIRNLNLPDKRFKSILDMYETGKAVWWASDRF